MMRICVSPRDKGVASALMALMLLLAGCGGSEGPPKFHIEGAVTFEGEPVPAGEISFEPDSSQGNSGPGTIVPIIDGRYNSSGTGGIIGGPMIARIVGYDGNAVEQSDFGVSLFSQISVSVDLPQEDTSYDFELTADQQAQ